MPQVLSLVEEAWYTTDELLQKIKAEVPEENANAALQALTEFSLSRAALTRPWTLEIPEAEADLEDARDNSDVPNEDLAPYAADRIQLLRVVGQGNQWKVGGIVGSGMLEDVGLAFEVLPKIPVGEGENQETLARRALMRMWELAEGRPSIHEAIADVANGHTPTLHEWLIERFLDQLEALIARGIRLQYVEREDNLTSIRGKLLPRQNMLHNRFAPHRFYCRFDELSINRPENRLIRTALERVARSTSEMISKRRARSLIERLHEVPPSVRIGSDFAAWRNDRLMTHYRDIRFTCSWILNEEAPAPAQGSQRMFGCFVRMSSLFERYVTQWIREQFAGQQQFNGYTPAPQLSKEFCWPYPHNAGARPEVMRPDIVVSRQHENGRQVIGVLDAKWKERSVTDSMSRADLFQMIAYATFWMMDPQAQMPGLRRLALIYPSREKRPAQIFRLASPMGDVRLSMHWFRLPWQVQGEGDWNEGLQIAELFNHENEG